jgi:diguanylate cyclase (GGDEF)-like protein/PAS domain S-box-containing protein
MVKVASLIAIVTRRFRREHHLLNLSSWSMTLDGYQRTRSTLQSMKCEGSTTERSRRQKLCLGYNRARRVLADRYRFLVLNMSMQYRLIRALCFAIFALFLALCIKGFGHIAFLDLSRWLSLAAASLLCASIVVLLSLRLRWNLDLKAAVGHTNVDIGKIKAFDAITEERRGTDVVGIVGDFKKLSQAECTLRESEDQYRLLVATIPEVVWKTDAKGNVIFVSPQVETLLGYSAEEFRQQGDSLWFNSVHIDDKAKVGQAFESLIKDGKPYDIECRARKKNGEWFWAHDRAVATTDSKGLRVATGLISDISERKAGEESNRRYRLLFENMSEGVAHCEMIFDDRGHPIDFVYLAINNSFEKLTGLRNVVSRRFTEVVPERKDSQSELLERYGRVALTGSPERFEIELKGMGMWFSISAYGSGKGCFVAIFDNITERKLVEESLVFKTALLEAQAETTIDGILVVDESGHIVLANKQFGLHLGVPDDLLSAQDDHLVLKHLMTKIEAPEPFVERVKYLYGHRDEKSSDEFRLKNGKVFDRYSAPLVDSNSRYRGRIWYFRDITDRKLAEERIQFLAYYDALTGLPNRTLFQDRLTTALAIARRQKEKVALLFLDLDKFKDINDSLGHPVGDLLLQKVAERLKKWGREQDTVARLGGDEFLISLTQVKDIPDVAVAAERLMDTLTAGFIVQGHSLNVSCSIGIGIFPDHGADCGTLIKNADAAMYSAKADGRNNFRFFNKDMNAQAVERLTFENGLRSALAKEQLFLMYQPQLDIATGKITGVEALLRWQHPDFGLVPPDKFIRIAENSGLILPIGEWALQTACRQARKWQDEGLPAVTVAVNVSAVQFRQEGFCGLIRKVLEETGLAARCLELELTESLLLANADVTLSVLRELKSMGLTLAIDDFGTGYSNFTSLRQFAVSKLKIDRSFISDVPMNPDDSAITAAIISMAKSLRLKVIAEGVENEAQMSFLRSHQCDEIQGYYFSKPLTVDKVADKLRENTSEIHARAQAGGGLS